MKYGYLGNLLSSIMFKDKFTAMRCSTGINPDGSISSKVLDSFLVDEPCLVYPLTKDSSRDKNKDVAEEKQSFTLFYGNHCGIKKGDVLILTILDDFGNEQKVIEGFAGAPCPYPDHTEVDVYNWKVKS